MYRRLFVVISVALCGHSVWAAYPPSFAITSYQCDPILCWSDLLAAPGTVEDNTITINAECENEISPGPQAQGFASVIGCSFYTGLNVTAQMMPNGQGGSPSYFEDGIGLIYPDFVKATGMVYGDLFDTGEPDFLIWTMDEQSDCYSNSVHEDLPPDDPC